MSEVTNAVRLTEVDYDPFAQPELARAVPTTDAQRELWLASQLGQEASLAFNESVTLRMSGSLHLQALQDALLALSDRHESLRSTFGADGMTMLIAPRGTLQARLLDLSAQAAAAQTEALAALKRHEVTEPFNLTRGPLVQATLVRLGAALHELVVTAHHIVCDGWSFGVVSRELMALYGAFAGGQAQAALPPADSFGDYVLAGHGNEQTRATEADERYWVQVFDGSVPVLDLPADRPRGSVRGFASRREDLVLRPDLVQAARTLGAPRGASLFATLFGLFAGLMGRLGGEPDVVVGVPAAGQAAAGMDALVGHCVNLLPVRVDADPTQSVDTLLRHARGRVLDAYEHQGCTFGRLLSKLQLARDPSRLPLVSVQFNIDAAIQSEELSVAGLTVDMVSNPRAFENFDLFVNGSRQVGGTVVLECQYNTDLFDAETVQRWLRLYQAAIERASTDPQLPLAALFTATAEDTSRIAGFNATAVDYPRQARVEHLITAQVARTPAAPAIVDDGDSPLSYRELEERANALALALVAQGVGPGRLVGLACSRSRHLLVGLLGILKSGAGYVPLDPAFPVDRLAHMRGDADLTVIVSDSATVAGLAVGDAQVLLADALQPSAQGPAPSTDTHAPAYVIYTSGSTGRPKGVVVPQGAVVNFLASMAQVPGLAAQDKLVAVTTPSFDIAVLELLLPLTVGAQLILASRDTVMDGPALRALIERHQANVMQATPSGWRLLLDAGWAGTRDFRALVGGEALPADLAQRLLARTGELWNMYGPTETTIWSTCWRVRPQVAISIGTPIANTVVQVLDERLQRCPIGVPGEILIGGDGVTLGYLHRPELTAEKFLPDPSQPGKWVYRTGDRGRWRNDGLLEHLGRLDFQVKVRGYRIELGEIETQLLRHPAIERAVVVTREDEPGDVRLVAYVVARGGDAPSLTSLRETLGAHLPDYMLPQHVVVLTSLPLLPNGKIHRSALPAPERAARPLQRDASPDAQLSPNQRLVAATMAQVLRLSGVDLNDNFFALGGHSLIAAQLVARIGQALDRHIPMRALFEAQTPASLVRWIDASHVAQTQPARSIPHRADQSCAPASLMQQRLWFLEQLDPGRLTYNTPSAHRLCGRLDVEALELAFTEMVRRQSALRTVMAEADGAPVQVVLEPWQVSLSPVDDLASVPASKRAAELQTRMQAVADTPFDLTRGPLFVARLYRMSDGEYVLLFMTHHIIWDGWSFDIFYEEMAALYDAFSRGQTPTLAALPVTYGDFAAWHATWIQGAELDRQLAFWKARLAGAPALLELPLDLPRPPRQTGQGATVSLVLPAELLAQARAHSLASGSTLFMTLFTAYSALLGRLSGQQDIVIGTPVRGRHSEQVEKVMGFFVNALPLRASIRFDDSFDDLLARIRHDVVDAFEHQDVPFEQLVRVLDAPRDESHSPIYQAFFSFQDARDRIRQWGTLRQEQLMLFQRGAAEDLGLWFLERPDGLFGGLTYNTDVLTEVTVRTWAARYVELLRGALAAPKAPLASLPMLLPQERSQLERWNDTRTVLPGADTVPALLEAACARFGSRIALQCDGQTLEYAQLSGRSARLARHLRSLGVRRGSLIGLCLPRNASMVTAQLAVLRTGAAYVPLDPAYPAERLAYMASDAQLALLVTESSLLHALDWPRERSVLLDIDAARIAACTDAPLEPEAALDARPEDPAYVIYTSGSTGRPKGVVVPHGAVVNFLASMAREPGLADSDRLVAVTTLSFDIAVLELLLPLTVGAQVILASREQVLDGRALLELLRASDATVMQATPSLWRMLIDAGWQGAPGFKALVGGEALPVELAQQLRTRCTEVWNMYGPTETTVWSTCWKLDDLQHGISIGTPIANTTVWVLDARHQLCPIGVPGELCIGGDGVSSGYLHQRELTAERFIPDPLNPGGRLYRTGDRGRWRNDGLLEHLGRLDFQVKLRGHRIELGEIEAAISSHPQVAHCVAIVREDTPGDARLVAYIVAHGQAPSPAELREHLKTQLPEYMLPQHVLALPTLPLLPNGKINRKELPVPAIEVESRLEGRLPASDSERVVAEIWSQLLGVRPITADDNFFDLGGHSLLAMRAAHEIERRLGTKVPVRRLIFESLGQICRDLGSGSDMQDLADRQAQSPGLMSRLFRAANKLRRIKEPQ